MRRKRENGGKKRKVEGRIKKDEVVKVGKLKHERSIRIKFEGGRRGKLLC
jgi:hypothetical protein